MTVLVACLSLEFACKFQGPRCRWIRRAGIFSVELELPANIVPLPPKCPELNLQENVWQFLRENWLSNRVFASYVGLVEHYCDAGTAL